MTAAHAGINFTQDELFELTAFAEDMAIAAGKAILPHFRKPITIDNKNKGQGYDPVTEADKAAERVMRNMIEKRFPGHGIVGEEYGTKESADGPYWVLDPLDGTRAFIAGLPSWGTLIAFNDGTRPIIGIVSQPYIGERFVGIHTERLKQATLNGRDIKCRPCPDIEHAVLSTTGLNFLSGNERDAFLSLEKRAPITRYGFDCYAYAMLATGFMDLVAEAGLQSYDIQALIPLIEGAGGQVTGWKGEDAQAGGRVLATGDKRLHQAALRHFETVPND